MKINPSRRERLPPTEARDDVPFRTDEGSDAELDSERHRTAIAGVGQRDLYGGGGWETRRGVATVDVFGADATSASPEGRPSYKRSDVRILEDIEEALRERLDIDSSDVDVTIRDGEVTLSGTVPDQLMKYEAELLCNSVPGVVDVFNRLRVRGEEDTEPM